MPLPTQPPGGEYGRVIHWAYRGTDRDGSWFGYLWGPLLGFTTHVGRRTQPCLDVLTKGDLTCPLCEAKLPRRWVGYVPVVREMDGRPCMVIVHESAASHLVGVQWRDRVLVQRGAEQSDGVVVARAPVARVWTTTLRQLSRPADLTRTLLKVWKMLDLTDWYERTHGLDEPPIEVPGQERPTVVGDVDEEDPAVRVLRAVQARGGQASSCGQGLIGESLNGTHRP